MDIQLEISAENAQCDNECMFLHADLLDRVGKCLLFNESLSPKVTYDAVEYWRQCVRCKVVSRQF